MEKIYLDMNTKYLTNHGIKYINEINSKDSLLILNKANRLVECPNFFISYKDFNCSYDNFDSNYSRSIASIPLNNNSCTYMINSIKAEKSEFYIGNIEQDFWYKDISYDTALLLSMFITDYFIKVDDDMLIRKNKIPNKVSFHIFKEFNKKFGIYFPYNTLNKSYNFRSSLYRNYDELSQEIVNNINIFKLIVDDIIEFNLAKGYNYKSLIFTNYSLANIIQVLFSLNGYYTRITRDGELFKITIINSKEADFLHRKRHDVIKYTNDVNMANIILDKFEGKLITSQEIEGITTISIINANSSYNILGDD